MTTIADEQDNKPLYKLLNDESIIREVQWLLSLHLEHFTCKDSTIPCAKCRSMAEKLTPLYLVGIEGIGEAKGWMTRPLARAAIDKMSTQKWSIERPWKPNSIPIIIEPSNTSATSSSLVGSLFSNLIDLDKDNKKSFTYKLVKRTRRKK